MSEISETIISITLVMSAVFIPVSFLSGPAGLFTGLISAVNALTLSPALCALLLKPYRL
jgi:HAE1 family hydrophobic/amphiphilic exporter-1